MKRKNASKLRFEGPTQHRRRHAPAPGPRPPSYQDAHWGKTAHASRLREVPDPKKNSKLIALGRLVSVVYETEKGDDGVSEYEHAFGHGFAAQRPWLAYGNVDGRLYIVEGHYKVTVRGIEG